MTEPPALKGRKVAIERIVVGPLGANCYVVAGSTSGDAIIIDPGGDPRKIEAFLRRAGLTARLVVNTHGHGDHIAANGSFRVPINIHRADAAFLTDPIKNMSASFLAPFTSPAAARLLEDGDTVAVSDVELKVIHTPGHTPGSICLAMQGGVFTGDTLFQGGVGRTDLPQGDERALYNSIRGRLLTLDPGTVIYPGHGALSTIGEERPNF